MKSESTQVVVCFQCLRDGFRLLLYFCSHGVIVSLKLEETEIGYVCVFMPN